MNFILSRPHSTEGCICFISGGTWVWRSDKAHATEITGKVAIFQMHKNINFSDCNLESPPGSWRPRPLLRRKRLRCGLHPWPAHRRWTFSQRHSRTRSSRAGRPQLLPFACLVFLFFSVENFPSLAQKAKGQKESQPSKRSHFSFFLRSSLYDSTVHTDSRSCGYLCQSRAAAIGVIDHWSLTVLSSPVAAERSAEQVERDDFNFTHAVCQLHPS